MPRRLSRRRGDKVLSGQSKFQSKSRLGSSQSSADRSRSSAESSKPKLSCTASSCPASSSEADPPSLGRSDQWVDQGILLAP